MKAYYQSTIKDFMVSSNEEVLGALSALHFQKLEHQQTRAWSFQIDYLQSQLRADWDGKIYFEFMIPRMGKRADCVLLLGACIFVIEFKVGSSGFDSSAIDQVVDYAMDLKNFHLGSHRLPIFPIVLSSKAAPVGDQRIMLAPDLVSSPLRASMDNLTALIDYCCKTVALDFPELECDIAVWEASGYMPTPTIIEAAQALYSSHSVEDIARSDAGAKNLTNTTDEIFKIVEKSKSENKKSICFITGVPGAGKTLAGLNIATSRSDKADEHAVFLSGNGPLVNVLREALARDKASNSQIKKKEAEREVRSFIQNIHHFRDEYFTNSSAPIEKVVIFDEAQRAWSKEQATKFMIGKWGAGYSPQSEPEFLISVMDRHEDWCCVICLIGGGQEINTGEAGIIEWLNALDTSSSDWDVYTSNILLDEHYTIDDRARNKLQSSSYKNSDYLHLSTSMRSFRAETVSSFVAELLDGSTQNARSMYLSLSDRYPITVTRDLGAAKSWLHSNARGSERTGLVASAGALRLRAEGIFIKSEIDPASWFLNNKDDVRSSFFLEDVATQFDVQGLELDWVGVCWDADLRREENKWSSYSFRGTKWQKVASEERKTYLLNAYRVLLTRARQGMVIFVPQGDKSDHTRPPDYYDGVYEFLRSCGVRAVS